MRGQCVGNIDVLVGRKRRSVAFRGDVRADTETETRPDQTRPDVTKQISKNRSIKIGTYS